MRSALLLLALGLAPASAQPPAKTIFTPDGQAILDKTLDNLYGLEYAKAEAGFRQIVALEPDNPFSYLVEAAALWWKAATVGNFHRTSPAEEDLFETDVSSALVAADRYIRSKDPGRQADGHFVAGMVLGMRGQWEVLKLHWLKAYVDGKRAIKHLDACVHIDPAYDDAYLGLGIYDYQVAHFKRLFNLGFLLGARGNEARGIGLIRLAMEKGRVSSEQAALFLITVYIVDRQDYAGALPLVQKLRAQFPKSLYFQTLEIALDFDLGDKSGSLAAARATFDQIRRDPPAFQRKLLSLACGIAQKRCLDHDYAQKAADWFAIAVSTAGASAGEISAPEWPAFARLYRGYAEDLLDERASAEADYLAALSGADFIDVRKRAKKCLDKPCDAKDLLGYFKSTSAAVAGAGAAP